MVVCLIVLTSINMESTAALDSGGCSDPNGADWIEKRYVNGKAEWFRHTSGIVNPHFTHEGDVVIGITAAQAQAQCYIWNNNLGQ